MGLTKQSTRSAASGDVPAIVKSSDQEKVIALAGNPNVGKSTVFNALTGLNQHTGNWPGKTVSNAQGRYSHNGRDFYPGGYSRYLFSYGLLRRRRGSTGLRLLWPAGRRRGGSGCYLSGTESQSGASNFGDYR